LGVIISRSFKASAIAPREVMPSDAKDSITGFRSAAWASALLLMVSRAAVFPLAALRRAAAP